MERSTLPFGLTATIAALALASAAQAGVAVSLKASPATSGADVTLGDIFDGAPAAAAKIVVAKAPVPGANAIIEAGRVQAAARAAGLDWENAQGMRRVVVAGTPAPAAGKPVVKRAPALAWARNITAGEMVTAADLVWSE